MITVQNPVCSRAILWIEDLYRAFETIIQNRPSIGHHIYHVASFNDTVEGVAKAVSAHTDIGITIDSTDETNGGFSLDTARFEKDFSFEFKGTNDIIIEQLIENISSLCCDNQSLTLNCRVCKSDNTVTILDMGTQPLANNYVHCPSVQAEYPLCLIRCPECFHTQLNYVVKPEVMFRNYQYNSGTSSTLCKYFEYLADKIIVDTKIEKGIVIELACNDGSQLDYFKAKGWQTYGVDPAENIIKIGREKGHQIYSGFWGKDEFSEIPTADVILAQNVLAHVPDPIAFLAHCSKTMGTHTFLYIQTSQCNMYVNGEFDTIYHEHLSFFTIASMMKAASSCGLSIMDVSKQPIHGTSYLFKMRIGNDHSPSVYEMMNQEKSIGLYSDIFYESYRNRVEEIKQWVGTTLKGFVDKNITVIGYGAAAKGMTMLNYFDITNVEYIIDDATMKHNKYTPGKNILILPPSILSLEERPLAVFVFAWNFIEEITNKIKSYRNGKPTFIIQSFPFQTVVEL
jgi:SAM-dependent methyltransferase